MEMVRVPVHALKKGWRGPLAPVGTAAVLVRALWPPLQTAHSAAFRPGSVANSVAASARAVPIRWLAPLIYAEGIQSYGALRDERLPGRPSSQRTIGDPSG